MFFDEHGQLTHIHLAADLVTGPEGCGNRTGVHGGPAHFGHTPCDNCKYEDHGVSLVTSLIARLRSAPRTHSCVDPKYEATLNNKDTLHVMSTKQ